MTDYELLIAFVETGQTSQDAYMNFVSIVFGFIVAGYLVADKLSQKMVILITILFTVVAFQEALTAILFAHDQFGLIPEMQTRIGLQFHGSSSIGDYPADAIYVMFISTPVLAYVGSIIFFFHQRSMGLKTS